MNVNEQQQPTSAAVERLVRLPEVLHLTGLRKSSIYEYLKTGRFPGAVLLTERAVAWRLSEVERWIAMRPSTAAQTEAVLDQAQPKSGASSRKPAPRKTSGTTSKRIASTTRKSRA